MSYSTYAELNKCYMEKIRAMFKVVPMTKRIQWQEYVVISHVPVCRRCGGTGKIYESQAVADGMGGVDFDTYIEPCPICKEKQGGIHEESQVRNQESMAY